MFLFDFRTDNFLAPENATKMAETCNKGRAISDPAVEPCLIRTLVQILPKVVPSLPPHWNPLLKQSPR
jgi:hypothetical protein